MSVPRLNSSGRLTIAAPASSTPTCSRATNSLFRLTDAPIPMRIVIDYRPALRARTGVGEYVHQLARALGRRFPDDRLTLFSSSWSDRFDAAIADDMPGASLSDHRVPVRALNFLWHHAEWPSVERFIGTDCDVAFSPHPLLLPSRAAQVVMVHDLDFLRHPERTQREIRRDYPRFAGSHARRAHAVVVPSQYTATEVQHLLQVDPERIAVCPPGLPAWRHSPTGFDRSGYLLFVGTTEPRKNVDGLLRAYERLVQRWPDAPRLVLAGKPAADAGGVAERLTQSPLATRVDQLGYVAEEKRQDVYAGARALVLPSFEEGFGMPALEAMSLGIPVVVSNRGALPEVVGDAGLLVDPTDTDALCDSLRRVLADDQLATTLATRGRAHAAPFSWDRTATLVRAAFAAALQRRRGLSID
jgi:glycosyltransferase involved in cell wall biosynthesis